MPLSSIHSLDFGKDFHWGVALAAQQNEGGRNAGGRTDSIWDTFAEVKGKVKNGDTIGDACDFYHRYEEDIRLTKLLGFNSFRFSISWSRILPDATGKANAAGIAFYHKIIDACLTAGLQPFVTLYHWDLPLCLELQGGWTSQRMPVWFRHFAKVCAKNFGDKVKYWLILNEPMGFTSLGYLLGQHAPGKRNMKGFFTAVHNALLAQSIGGKTIRNFTQNAIIGTTFSCSEIIPFRQTEEDFDAAKRVDAMMNRLFIEPALGLGYPTIGNFNLLERMEIHNLAWRYKQNMKFDFDFIGLQNYFPLVVKYNALIPYIHASEVKAKDRKVPTTALGWESNSDSFYNIIQQFAQYKGVREIMITENGAAYKDKITDGLINDNNRIEYFKKHLAALKKAQGNGTNITGYFAWTLMDNFEWALGYRAKFGLVAVNRETQKRTIKKSGYWFQSFLRS